MLYNFWALHYWGLEGSVGEIEQLVTLVLLEGKACRQRPDRFIGNHFARNHAAALSFVYDRTINLFLAMCYLCQLFQLTFVNNQALVMH